MFCTNYDDFVATLKSHGFSPHSASTKAEALKKALELVGDRSVGVGGSMSTSEIGLVEAILERGNSLNTHNNVPREKAEEERRKAREAQCYICSTNAITRDGKLVNIDGMGNRVSSMIYGPESVILIVGKNKFTENTDDALRRIRAIACPKNAVRLNRKTPCGITGICTDCDSPDRMCSVTCITERRPTGIAKFHLILVDEALGY